MKFPLFGAIIIVMNKRIREIEIKIILECFVEECEIKGRLLSVEEFMDDIENSIGWDEVRES